MEVLRERAVAGELVLLLDIDALERSALAKVDRVMVLALTALANANVQIGLLARSQPQRAVALQRGVTSAWCLPAEADTIRVHIRKFLPDAAVIVLSDDPELLRALAPTDCGLALGRPELVAPHIAAIGDTGVRATLWWLLEERLRGGRA
jgi:hypothetical protein